MKCKYITIEREYGSAGTTIARRLAEECGIPCYGREILEEMSKEQDIPIEKVEKYEEAATNSLLYSLFMMSQTHVGNTGDVLTAEGYVYVAEQETIRKMAKNGPAIFLGHCASEALRESHGVVKIFIRCSDSKEKKQRIMDEYGIAEAEVEATRKRFDKKRSNYYYANTAHKWDDAKNYDIVLDSAALGIDGCVAVLKGLLA